MSGLVPMSDLIADDLLLDRIGARAVDSGDALSCALGALAAHADTPLGTRVVRRRGGRKRVFTALTALAVGASGAGVAAAVTLPERSAPSRAADVDRRVVTRVSPATPGLGAVPRTLGGSAGAAAEPWVVLRRPDGTVVLAPPIAAGVVPVAVSTAVVHAVAGLALGTPPVAPTEASSGGSTDASATGEDGSAHDGTGDGGAAAAPGGVDDTTTPDGATSNTTKGTAKGPVKGSHGGTTVKPAKGPKPTAVDPGTADDGSGPVLGTQLTPLVPATKGASGSRKEKAPVLPPAPSGAGDDLVLQDEPAPSTASPEGDVATDGPGAGQGKGGAPADGGSIVRGGKPVAPADPAADGTTPVASSDPVPLATGAGPEAPSGAPSDSSSSSSGSSPDVAQVTSGS